MDTPHSENLKQLIHAICQKKSIVEYLAKIGHKPSKTMAGGKLSYCCPLPDHKESKPSFVVYTQSDYENFYCFGCQAKHTIIDLVAGIERISWKDAVEKLSEGIEFSIPQNIDFDANEWITLSRQQGSKLLGNATKNLAETMWTIGNFCRAYLDSVNKDPLECEIIDKFYAAVDKDLFDLDFDSIEESLSHLLTVIKLRYKKFKQLEAERLRAKII
jgi:DNA primase